MINKGIVTDSDTEIKTILKYPGAKNRIADWIVSFVPEHKVYLEPFFGSGAVFFHKQKARIETINDLDNNVYIFFKVLRNEPEELAQRLRLTPYGREEYNKAFEETMDEIEIARRFSIKCWQGFGCSNVYKNGFRSSQQSVSPQTTKHWIELPDRLVWAAERLKQAQIENLPAIELMKRYNTEDVFIYLDPPYLHGTRKNYLYKHEMKDTDHIVLLEAVKNHPGKVLISGYENDMYNTILSGWNKAQKDTQAEFGYARTETLWFNYDLERQGVGE